VYVDLLLRSPFKNKVEKKEDQRYLDTVNQKDKYKE